MEQTGPKWTEIDQMDQIDRSEPNRPKWTEWTVVDPMRLNELKCYADVA